MAEEYSSKRFYLTSREAIKRSKRSRGFFTGSPILERFRREMAEKRKREGEFDLEKWQAEIKAKYEQ